MAGRLYLPLASDLAGSGSTASEEAQNWHSAPVSVHHPSVKDLPKEQQHVERQRGARQLLHGESKSFLTQCTKDELSIEVTLETPSGAQRLLRQAQALQSDMHELPSTLLEQFIEKDYGDDLLLLTALDNKGGGQLAGLIFWRDIRSSEDDVWDHMHVDWEAEGGLKEGSAVRIKGLCSHPELNGTDGVCESWDQSRGRWTVKLDGGEAKALRPVNLVGLELPPGSQASFGDAWTCIELLCTDTKYRGHGIGKLLLATALAYSAVKNHRTACTLIVSNGVGHDAAKALYKKLGFEEMPEEHFSKSCEKGPLDPKNVMVMWNIKHSLKELCIRDVDCHSKGTSVEGLPPVRDPLRHLDSTVSAELVNRLTG